MGFGKRLKEIRIDKGLNRDELAKKVGVSRSAISNYENEISHPKEQIMYDLMKALDVDANYLFQDEINVQTYDQLLLQKYHESPEGIRESINKLLDMPE